MWSSPHRGLPVNYKSGASARATAYLLWGANSAEWVVSFFGCALCGVIVVPLDDAGAVDFAQRICKRVEAKLLVCSRTHSLSLTSNSCPALILEDLQEILSGHSPEPFDAASIVPTDALEVVFTSGTTAEPKGVVISHGNVLGNIAPLETEIQKYLKYERLVHPVRFLNLLPLSHVFGQFLGIFLPQLLGGTVIFQDALKPSEVIRTIRRERVSVLVAVPRMLQSLKEKIERDLEEDDELKEFRTKYEHAAGKHFLRRWWIFRKIHRQMGWKFWGFICGGAALDRTTEEFWGRLGYAVIQGYGLTETTSIVSVNHPFRPRSGVDWQSARRPRGQTGCRWRNHGPGQRRGRRILERSRLKPMSGEQGWYGTGDIGDLEPAGNLYFKGRKKDVICHPSRHECLSRGPRGGIAPPA